MPKLSMIRSDGDARETVIGSAQQATHWKRRRVEQQESGDRRFLPPAERRGRAL